jgi:hypothetical protein
MPAPNQASQVHVQRLRPRSGTHGGGHLREQSPPRLSSRGAGDLRTRADQGK